MFLKLHQPKPLIRSLVLADLAFSAAAIAEPLEISETSTPQTDGGLPADPGENGKETLIGIDSDLDGVRDDVQRYILLTYRHQLSIQLALLDFAKTIQQVFATNLSHSDALKIAEQLAINSQCLHYYSGDASKIQKLLKSEILNTDQRITHHLQNYDEKLAGSSIELSSLPLSEHHKLCSFSKL